MLLCIGLDEILLSEVRSQPEFGEGYVVAAAAGILLLLLLLRSFMRDFSQCSQLDVLVRWCCRCGCWGRFCLPRESIEYWVVNRRRRSSCLSLDNCSSCD